MFNVILNLEKAKNQNTRSYAQIEANGPKPYQNNETLTLEGQLAQSMANGLCLADKDLKSRNDGQKKQ